MLLPGWGSGRVLIAPKTKPAEGEGAVGGRRRSCNHHPNVHSEVFPALQRINVGVGILQSLTLDLQRSPSDDLAVTEGVEIATSNFEPLAVVIVPAPSTVLSRSPSMKC
jgi:hypothetical protein